MNGSSLEVHERLELSSVRRGYFCMQRGGMTEELMNVVLRVNGTAHSVAIEPRVTLLDALREHLGLTGTKKGCDQGAVRRVHGARGRPSASIPA